MSDAAERDLDALARRLFSASVDLRGALEADEPASAEHLREARVSRDDAFVAFRRAVEAGARPSEAVRAVVARVRAPESTRLPGLVFGRVGRVVVERVRRVVVSRALSRRHGVVAERSLTV